MPVQIDSMRTEVDVLGSPDRGAGGGGDAGGASAARDRGELKELLRPLVLEIMSEELETYMRMRG